MVLQELVCLVLVVGDLQVVREFCLVLARGQVPVDAADPGQQEQDAGQDAEDAGGGEETDGPRFVRGCLQLIFVSSVLLLEEETVQVGSCVSDAGRRLV